MTVFIFSGCLFVSVQPFYHEDDVFIHKTMNGVWHEDEETSWTFSEEFGQLYYNVTIADIDDESEPPQIFVGHLFKINKTHYLDLEPTEKSVDDTMDNLFIPIHLLYEVKFYQNKIKLFHYEWNFDKLDDLVERNKINISYVKTENGEVFVSSTEELQRFIKNYSNNKKYKILKKHDITLRKFSELPK